MVLNTPEMRFNGIKIALFSKSRPAAQQRLEALLPDPCLWYVWVTIACLHSSSNLGIFPF